MKYKYTLFMLIVLLKTQHFISASPSIPTDTIIPTCTVCRDDAQCDSSLQCLHHRCVADRQALATCEGHAPCAPCVADYHCRRGLCISDRCMPSVSEQHDGMCGSHQPRKACFYCDETSDDAVCDGDSQCVSNVCVSAGVACDNDHMEAETVTVRGSASVAEEYEDQNIGMFHPVVKGSASSWDGPEGLSTGDDDAHGRGEGPNENNKDNWDGGEGMSTSTSASGTGSTMNQGQGDDDDDDEDDEDDGEIDKTVRLTDREVQVLEEDDENMELQMFKSISREFGIDENDLLLNDIDDVNIKGQGTMTSSCMSNDNDDETRNDAKCQKS